MVILSPVKEAGNLCLQLVLVGILILRHLVPKFGKSAEDVDRGIFASVRRVLEECKGGLNLNHLLNSVDSVHRPDGSYAHRSQAIIRELSRDSDPGQAGG